MRIILATWTTVLLMAILPGCADYGAGPDSGEFNGDGDAGSDSGSDGGIDGSDAVADRPGDAGNQDCPRYVSALADCPYQLFRSTVVPYACMQFRCLDQRCETDDDCPSGGALETGSICAAGNCVFCANDTACPPDQLCRGGRCVKPEPDDCHPPVSCEQSRCNPVDPSEVPCPVCTCDSLFSHTCEADIDCLVYSHHPYHRCLYGRCADCRSDEDCAWGQCLPPGLCYQTEPALDELYGTWLLGIAAGMDHFSYFRFEPDGTLRRGAYEMSGAWSDDIPALPCFPEGVIPSPLIGTWEPEVTNSGFLVIRMALNVSCDDGEGWSARFAVEFSDDPLNTWFRDVEGQNHLQAFRVPGSACSDDFAVCELPDVY